MLSLFSSFFSVFFPTRCAYCSSPFFPDKNKSLYGICAECAKELVRREYAYCLRCGNIFSDSPEEFLYSSCGVCHAKELPWTKLSFFSVYDGLLKDIIKEAKFHSNLIFLRTLGDLIYPLILEQSDFDFLIPMPIHTKRLRHRGYNQCLEIIKYLNKKHGVPYVLNALTKVKHTKAQSTLSYKERITNLDNTFVADKKLVYNKTILLFDDVSTTSTTLYKASTALLDAGAKEVFVLYIARAISKSF